MRLTPRTIFGDKLLTNKQDKTMKKAYNIDWETDGQDVDLPDEVELPEDIDTDAIGEVEDYLSDEYGYLVNSFEIYDDEEDDVCHDSMELIDKLELDDEMPCNEIFEKVFEYLDDNEDGQIPRSIVVATADGITREICQHFDIDFISNE